MERMKEERREERKEDSEGDFDIGAKKGKMQDNNEEK